MSYAITQRDVDILTNRDRIAFIKLELINVHDQVIDNLEGECIDGTLSLQSKSDIRRTCALTLAVKDSSYVAAENTKIWLDKRIRLYYGLYDRLIRSPRYYLMGTFMIANGEYTFDAVSRKLKASLVDMMAMATTERGSAIGAIKTVIEAGSGIRNAMVATAADLVGWTRYNICTFEEGGGDVPYDIELGTGIYPHEIIAKLRDLYPYYETFMDVYGTFVCQKIPTCLSDEVVLKAEIMDQLILESGIKPKINFSEVKNTTEIWGMSLSADRWSEECETVDGIYTIAIPDIEVMDNGVTYGFKVDVGSISGQRIQINDLPAYPVYILSTLSDGTSVDVPIEPGRMKEGVPYVLLYSDSRFYLQGELEIHVIVMEVNQEPDEEKKECHRGIHNCDNIRYVVNPESPFAADRQGIGIIKQVLSGGEYADIYTTELAFDRAAYENWKTTRLVETIQFDSIMVPWLDANHKIELTSQITLSKEQYLTTSVNFNFANSTMSVEAIRFYPYYPWLT